MTTSPLREEDVFTRPTPDEIRSTWKALFSDPLISLSKLRSRSLDKAGLGQAGPDGGVVLRSVYWRFYHNLLPPPTSLDLFPPALERSREAYNSLRRRYLVAPDGRWASDCSSNDGVPSAYPSSPNPDSPSPSSPTPNQNEGWDPLSLSTSSPWKTWFAHTELRATIRQDVSRTFPDMPYFQLERVARCLTTALFIFSVLNPDVGYRQGMHELLACCFLAVDRDSLDGGEGGSGEGEVAMARTLDRRYVEHDAFELFQSIMKSGKAFYEWRAEEGPVKSRTAAPQAPIIIRCNNLHTSLIRRIDPQLWERLETEGVEAQIWAIRWLRLIFTRELPFHLAMRIWDGLFAEDPGLQLIDFICVAMLLLVRNELIEADYPTLLTNLLHYPSPSSSYPFEPFLLLSQALFLRSNISPAAGVEVVIQNQDILGVRAAPPDREKEKDEDSDIRDLRGSNWARGGGRGRGAGMRGGSASVPSSVRARMQKAGVGGLAQGLFERAQAAGLDKAFLSTVADFKKNLPDSQTAYSYLPHLPFSPTGSPGGREAGSFSSIPSSSSALPPRSLFSSSPSSFPSRPPIKSRPSMDSQASVKTVKDAEREMAELRLAMLGMGKAMSEWMEVLRPSEGSTQAVSEDSEKEAAWRGMDRVKNTLIDAAGKEVDEIVREWGWHEGLEAPRSRATTPVPLSLDDAPPVPPIPAEFAPSAPAPAPQETAGSSVVPSSMEFEDTPTPASVSVFPSTPRIPSATRGPSISPPKPASSRSPVGYKPSQRLSSRNDTPISGLPRVPQTAPLSSAFARYQPEEAARPASAGLGERKRDDRRSTGPRGEAGGEGGSGDAAPGNADPLAGLGVTVRDEGWKGGGEPASKKRGVDPLLGLGVR
ncbi:hypothetical protein IAT38_002496 [Cryptococcus sp. DSM 104549]